jgi:hypothetical protein
VDHVLGSKDDVLGGLRKPDLHPHERMNRVLDVLLLTPVRHVRNTSWLGQHDENDDGERMERVTNLRLKVTG